MESQPIEDKPSCQLDLEDQTTTGGDRSLILEELHSPKLNIIKIDLGSD